MHTPCPTKAPDFSHVQKLKPNDDERKDSDDNSEFDALPRIWAVIDLQLIEKILLKEIAYANEPMHTIGSAHQVIH